MIGAILEVPLLLGSSALSPLPVLIRACKDFAAEVIGVGNGNRTRNRRSHSPVLCQLSYSHRRNFIIAIGGEERRRASGARPGAFRSKSNPAGLCVNSTHRTTIETPNRANSMFRALRRRGSFSGGTVVVITVDAECIHEEIDGDEGGPAHEGLRAKR